VSAEEVFGNDSLTQRSEDPRSRSRKTSQLAPCCP
jgi:hypothetical protein